LKLRVASPIGLLLLIAACAPPPAPNYQAPNPVYCSPPTPVPGDLVVGANAGIMWGINGHPVQGGPYTAISPAAQMSAVAKAGFRSYRMDLYEAGAASMNILQTYVNAGKAAGVKILPVVIPDPIGYASEQAAYQVGFYLANAYVAKFKNDIHIWEWGNEYEGKVGYRDQGSTIDLYNQANYVQARGLVRGMLDGMRVADPTAKGIVDSSGGCGWGFLDGLWRDGVRWDITGEHWYSGAGPITNVPCMVGVVNKFELLQRSFGVPIWITEFNYNQGSNKTSMGNWLVARLQEWSGLAKQYGIEAGHIYELYDQPIAGMEGAYGLWNGSGVINAAGTAVSNYLAQHPSVVYR
jgi:hypothetical protein